MKLKSERMSPLIERAYDKENKAAKELSSQSSKCSQQEQRLRELAQYRAEYDDQVKVGTVTNPAMLQNRAAFLARVEQAVTQQQQTLDNSKSRLEVERTRLILASRDKQVLQKLADSYKAEEVRVDQKREQNTLDELSGRRTPTALGSDPEEQV